MTYVFNKGLIVLSGSEPAALDLAARIGLEADGLHFPVAISDRQETLPERSLILIGAKNLCLPDSFIMPELGPGEGAIASLCEEKGVLIWGFDEEGQRLACRWAAALWDGLIPDQTMIIKPGALDEDSLPLIKGSKVVQSSWPRLERWRCLSQVYSVEGLLGSSDGLFPDQTRVDFRVSPDISVGTFAKVCNLAARVGLESSGFCFPLSGSGGKKIFIGSEVENGWIAVKDSALYLGVGSGLDWALDYMAAEYPKLPSKSDWLEWDLLAAADLLGFKEHPVTEELYHASWEDRGEASRLTETWEEEVIPAIKASCPSQRELRVDITVSEPKEQRSILKSVIKETLKAAGYTNSSVAVRPAFKQGFHWLVNEVLPEVRDLDAERIIIYFRPFDCCAARDMAIRWLQEIYPADEIFSREMDGVTVNFEQAPLDADHALSIEVHSEGLPVYRRGFTPRAALRPVLDGYPEEKMACHPTGWLEVAIKDGPVVISKRMPTDLERFWSWYSSEFLSAVERITGDVETEPLFGKLSIEYTGSEPEEKIGIREELDSPLEVLHQDLYFTTLDRFAALGERKRGVPFESPGSILPWLKAEPGASPRAVLRLTAAPARSAAKEFISGYHPGTGQIECNGCRQKLELPEPVLSKKTVNRQEPLYLEQVEKLLAELPRSGSCFDLRVKLVSRSTGGYPVYAVELNSTETGLTTPNKLALKRPTLLINARHHGNEVSSTGAVFDLLTHLTENRDLLDGINLVIVPYENVDGAEIHRDMARQNPVWKLHAARYNQDGREFYNEYFNQDTVFGEARALTRLWRAWLPDMVLDAHGIPSHEWIQFFSGYNSPPRFPISFWLPNAHFYGMLYEPDRLENVELGTSLLKSIINAIRSIEPIDRANKAWLECFSKYGYQFLPNQFPRELFDGAVVYRRPADKGFTFTERYPDITAVHCVTEVADETATGSYLTLCSKAHTVAMITAINWLAGLKSIRKNIVGRSTEGLILRVRKRIRAPELSRGIDVDKQGDNLG